MSEKTTILDELLFVSKVKRRKGEDDQAFLKRLALTVDKLGDDDWKELSEEAQVWNNEAIKASDADAEIELPEGMDPPDDEGESDEDVSGEEDLGEEEDDVEDASEEPAPRARRPAKKTAGKKRSAAAEPDKKPARGAAKKTPAKKKAGAAPAASDESDVDPDPAKKTGGGKKASAKKSAAPTKGDGRAPAKRPAKKKEPRAGSKRDLLMGMLQRKSGATVKEICDEFGWLPHTTRAAISVVRRSVTVDSQDSDKRGRIYRVDA